MPTWLDPILNTSLATGLVTFVCWCVVKFARFIGPQLTTFFDNNSSLTEHLKTNGCVMSECLDRLCQMGDHTVKGIDLLHQKTDALSKSVDVVKVDLHNVKGQVSKHNEILYGLSGEGENAH